MNEREGGLASKRESLCMCVFFSALCTFVLTEPHLMLYVGMYSLQHPLTGVLIRQIWLDLKMTRKHSSLLFPYFAYIKMYFFFAVTSLFTLIAINCLLSLFISADGGFYCQISARPNHSMSLLGNSLGFICIPIDHSPL